MSLSRSGRIEFASPVIEAESHIRRFLDLGDKKASVCSMHRARSDIDDITLARLDNVKDFIYSSGVTSVIEFLSAYLAGKSAIHLCTRLGIHHIPDFRLSERIISLTSHLIIRMNLDRKLVIDIKELDQKRELSSIIFIDIFSDHSFKICLHDVSDSITCQPAFSND